ncbi:MAG: DUF2333 family protein [Alphaproteobacteria bacterium]|nr:DUF2333 family protein [Alphaproteobacteria bacterium]
MADDARPEVLSDEAGGVGRTVRRVALGLAIIVAVILALYYPIGMAIVHVIDDDPGFDVPAPPAGASRAVAMAAALVKREIDTHRWTANDPFFLPGAALDNMPNYQMGIIGALARFAVELGDQVARTRGSSRIDPDLDRAAGLLRYPGNVWIFDPRISFAPTASSEAQYRAARKALIDYNERLAGKKQPAATFERRADNLLATLDRIAADLGSMSAALDRQVAERSGNLLDFAADDTFYATKGRLYAYGLILRALGIDFERVLADRGAKQLWEQMVASFREAAGLQPWVVMNGAPDSNLLPSHVAAQGFYLLRARTQLRELTDVLRK